jgi:2-phospho-L-lactate/phosphoenolpyruvate guanylyltransferase
VDPLIVVPHRGLEATKTRLAPILSPAARADLSRELLTRVLRAVGEAAGARCALVITPDPRLCEVTEPLGVRLLVQHGMGLNSGLEEARRLALDEGVGVLAVLHGDLPMLRSEDIGALLSAVPRPSGVAIAPDRAGSGTNGLAMRPASVIPFRFGAGSFTAHAAATRDAGARLAVVKRPGLAFDLDTPDDLTSWLAVARTAGDAA